ASRRRRGKPCQLLGVLRGDGPPVRDVPAAGGEAASRGPRRAGRISERLPVAPDDAISGDTTMKRTAVAIALLLIVVLWFVFLAGQASYPDTDARNVDRDRLFRQTEQLLAESEAWPAALTETGIVLATSLAPYPVRTVRYSVDVDGDFEKAVAYVKNENY